MREHFKYTIHNMIGHPLSEMAHVLGMNRISEWLHDITFPN